MHDTPNPVPPAVGPPLFFVPTPGKPVQQTPTQNQPPPATTGQVATNPWAPMTPVGRIPAGKSVAPTSPPIPTRSSPVQVEDVSAQFAVESTSLSKRLEAVELLFGKLPSLIRVHVPFRSEDGEHVLFLSRDVDGWHLWVWDECDDLSPEGDETFTNGRRLARASVEVKLAAIEVLPELVQRLKKVQLEQISRIQRANGQLDALVKSLQKEGA